MNVAIVGAGALGTLLAARLSGAGAKRGIRVLVRSQERAAALREAAPRAIVCTEAAELLPASLLFLCVKSYQVASALPTLQAPLAAAPAPIVALQNGWGHMDALAAAFPASPLVVGATTLGAYWDDAGAFHPSTAGVTTFAPWTEPARSARDAAASLFRDSGLRAEVASNARDVLWRKLVLNVAVNPVTAVHAVRNGALLEQPSLHGVALAAAREAVAVGAARGFLAAAYDPAPLLDALLRDTAANRSSMAEDVAHGRPTEADAILGALLREGAAAGLATPVAASLAERLRALSPSE